MDQAASPNPVSQQTRHEIWRALLKSDSLVRYYAAVTNRHRRQHVLTLLLLALGAAVSFATPWSALPHAVHFLASALVFSTTVWIWKSNDARKSTVAQMIGAECARLDLRCRHLWLDAPHLSESTARQRLLAISSEMRGAQRRAGDADLADHARLNRQAEEDARRTISARYGAPLPQC